MEHSARLYFTLLELVNLHFSSQGINVNSSKFQS